MTDVRTAATLPAPTSDPAEVKANLDEHGLAIVADLIDADRLAAVRARLVEQAAGERANGTTAASGGPRPADGPIQYVWQLISKGQEFRDLVTNPAALEYARHVLGPSITLFSYSGNAIGPGAPGGGAHTDQIYMPSDTPWPVVCNVIYMLDDFTVDNGATLVVPGSHRRSIKELDAETFGREAVNATGPAGSALVIESRIWHSIGINRTASTVRHGILAAYGKPFLRPQENWSFSTPTAIVEAAAPELRELLGFKIWRSLGGAQGPYGTQRDDATPSRPGREINNDWGWVEPVPRYVGELDASGRPRAAAS